MLIDRKGIVLYNPINQQCINEYDEFVDEGENPRIFDTILAADAHSAWFESVFGVQLYAKQYHGERK